MSSKQVMFLRMKLVEKKQLKNKYFRFSSRLQKSLVRFL